MPASPGNDYEVLSGGIIQTPSAGGLQTFPGDSLTLDSGARITATGFYDATLNFPGVNRNPGLILNGGLIQEAPQRGDAIFTIAGQMAILAPSAITHLYDDGGFVITAQLSGNGDLMLDDSADSAPVDIQSTNNLYSGSWYVQGGYLTGSGEGSLGTGNITVSNGATLEVDYDIQTAGRAHIDGKRQHDGSASELPVQRGVDQWRALGPGHIHLQQSAGPVPRQLRAGRVGRHHGDAGFGG